VELIERLARDLDEEFGRAEVDPAGGGVLVHARGDEPFDPPVRFVSSDSELRAHLSAMAEDAADVFPDVEPMQAAYQLFLVHIDEELATKVVPGSEMRLQDGTWNISPMRPPMAFDLPPGGGPYVFMSPEQFRSEVRRRRTAKKRRRWR
jgi:hypothetical protein